MRTKMTIISLLLMTTSGFSAPIGITPPSQTQSSLDVSQGVFDRSVSEGGKEDQHIFKSRAGGFTYSVTKATKEEWDNFFRNQAIDFPDLSKTRIAWALLNRSIQTTKFEDAPIVNVKIGDSEIPFYDWRDKEFMFTAHTITPNQWLIEKLELGASLPMFEGLYYLSCSVIDNKTPAYEGNFGDTDLFPMTLIVSIDPNAVILTAPADAWSPVSNHGLTSMVKAVKTYLGNLEKAQFNKQSLIEKDIVKGTMESILNLDLNRNKSNIPLLTPKQLVQQTENHHSAQEDYNEIIVLGDKIVQEWGGQKAKLHAILISDSSLDNFIEEKRNLSDKAKQALQQLLEKKIPLILVKHDRSREGRLDKKDLYAKTHELVKLYENMKVFTPEFEDKSQIMEIAENTITKEKESLENNLSVLKAQANLSNKEEFSKQLTESEITFWKTFLSLKDEEGFDRRKSRFKKNVEKVFGTLDLSEEAIKDRIMKLESELTHN